MRSAEGQRTDIRRWPRRNGWQELYFRRGGLLFALLALVILCWTLFCGSPVGLSNNGDFGRVMGAAGLTYRDQVPSHTFVDTFAIRLEGPSVFQNILRILFSPHGLDTYPSVHVAVVRASVALELLLNRLLGRELDVYHIESLGALYALAYAGGIGFLLSRFYLRPAYRDVLGKGAALVVLCDIGYSAYFNSFYGEALQHIALIYCAGMLIRVLTREPTMSDAVWCALLSVLYGWSKFFNIPLAILLLVCLEGTILVRSKRRRVLIPGAAGLAVLVLVWTAVPGWMDTATNYNAVFYGVVRDVDRDTAEGYLSDMGLPKELADYRDTNYYIPGVEESLRARGLDRAALSAGKAELLRFYLTHPKRLWEQARFTALHCGMIRPYYLANVGRGAPLMTYSQKMSLWSRVRDWLPQDSLWGCLAVTAAAGAAAALSFRRRRGTAGPALLSAALLGGMCYAFIMPVVLNGEGDLAKHMFTFGEIVDLALLGCLACGLGRCRRQPGGWVRPVILSVLAAALVLPGLLDAAGSIRRDRQSHDAPEVGAYVSLGRYRGNALTWLVAERTENGFLLLSTEEDISLPFDEAGGNAWQECSLRRWLNGAFLEGFSPEERALLLTEETPVILPDQYRPLEQTWDRTFACSHIAVLSDRLWERAYLAEITDTVRLAGIHTAAELAREGRLPRAGRGWWLVTPYCPSKNLVRYVGTDGHIYFGDASAPLSVRPVVEIRISKALAGSGSRSDPFVLDTNI